MYKFILAIRYLFKRRISYFAVAATCLCVFVVFVVITVLSGMTSQFKDKVHSSVGDCVVGTKSLVGFGYYEDFIAVLSEADFVAAVSPVIRSYALVNVTDKSDKLSMISTNSNETAEIMGIDPVLHSEVTGFAGWLKYNTGDAAGSFRPGYDPNLIGCVPGISFLFDRGRDGVYMIPDELQKAKIELSCFTLTSKGALLRAGAGEVSTKTFYYSDNTESGVAMADWKRIYIPFAEAQLLCGMGGELKRISAVFVKFTPAMDAEKGTEKVRAIWEKFAGGLSGARDSVLLENVTVQSWKKYNRTTVAAAETQQVMVMIVFGMIGIIMVFVVFVVFYMIVSHKSKDIGILKSVGVSNANVMSVFLWFAFMVGMAGSFIGAILGWRFLVHINQIEGWLFKHFRFQLWDRTMTSIGDIPNTIDVRVLGTIICLAVFACLAGAFIPGFQASRLRPVDSLQVSQL